MMLSFLPPTTFYMEGPWEAMATTGIFLAAAVTDWLEGYIARKMQLGTPFGAFLDLVADKLMVAATLVLLCTKPLESSLLNDGTWLLTVPSIAIIGKELQESRNLIRVLRFEALPSSGKEAIELLDILLRWIVLRFCESNTTCLLKTDMEVVFEVLKSLEDVEELDPEWLHDPHKLRAFVEKDTSSSDSCDVDPFGMVVMTPEGMQCRSRSPYSSGSDQDLSFSIYASL
ncbi:Cardiolipin synthase (CMP-forming), mitochondrial [Zea mays]|uniref:Cardiolipin synthase (CMP-forming), mitochondrial n=1 Tax=Zea mays TaxID=4577 RepID=A0A3L6FDZ7_MAIZE|nr:Cardiolipin synthase (CMP-forming), mitochondrial [Zea mays]